MRRKYCRKAVIEHFGQGRCKKGVLMNKARSWRRDPLTNREDNSKWYQKDDTSRTSNITSCELEGKTSAEEVMG